MAKTPDHRFEGFVMPLGLSSLGRSLKELPLAPVLSILFGAVAAILVLATPEWMFDRMVMESGLPSLAPSVSPPFGQAARILTSISAMWLVAGLLWPIFALVSSLLAPKPQKGKGHRIEASLEVAVPALQFQSLISAPLSSQRASGLAADTPDDLATSRIKAVVQRAANSNGFAPAEGETPPKAKINQPEIVANVPQSAEHEPASGAIVNRTIEPRKYKTRKGVPQPNEALDASSKALGGLETRH